jgi:hypothetical protein
MPKVKTKKTQFPDGWDEIEPFMDELDKEMRVGTITCFFLNPCHTPFTSALYCAYLFECCPHQ